MKLGEKIKTFRTNKMLTQEELARITGLSRVYVLQLESGRSKKPSAESLYKIAQALEAKVEDFFSDKVIEAPVNDPYKMLGWAIEQLKAVKKQLNQ
jgi:transcriptional regulator with XRE-family HTH domain